MAEWIDDNGVLEHALSDVLRGYFPNEIACCENPEPHFFFFRYRENRGSSWAWCSTCKQFVHLDGVFIPKQWENPQEIKLDDLSAVPIVLEERKQIADRQISAIKASLTNIRSA